MGSLDQLAQFYPNVPRDMIDDVLLNTRGDTDACLETLDDLNRRYHEAPCPSPMPTGRSEWSNWEPEPTRCLSPVRISPIGNWEFEATEMQRPFVDEESPRTCPKTYLASAADFGWEPPPPRRATSLITSTNVCEIDFQPPPQERRIQTKATAKKTPIRSNGTTVEASKSNVNGMRASKPVRPNSEPFSKKRLFVCRMHTILWL